MRRDILGNQGAQCVECEVVGLGFAWRRSCAEGMQPSAIWAGIKVRDAPAAEPVQLLGDAAAEVMPKERGAVLVEYLPADAARVPWPWMSSFTVGHPEERYSLSDDRLTAWECARFGAVWCGGLCLTVFLVVAVCLCAWLVAGLRVLVMKEEVVIHTAVRGVCCASCAYTWTRCCSCVSALLTAVSCM